MSAMLEAVKLSCERDDRTLFSGLSFAVDAGDWVQITGGNGTGKTSLLRILTGLSRPDGGEVRWQGQRIERIREDYHQQLLWIGHKPGVQGRLSTLENLRFYHPDGDTSRCVEALEQAGLAGFEDVQVHQLSAGLARRVALARLWLSRASLWILDEPFTAIDASGVASVTRRMEQHVARGGAIILTTHQPLNTPDVDVRRIALSDGDCAL